MTRLRITILNAPDRREQLRLASRVRSDDIENLHVHLDVEHPIRGIHRDVKNRPYFEFLAKSEDNVQELLREHCHSDYTEVTTSEASNGDACANCGNIAGPVLPPVCPNCGFRDIDPCPICGTESPRALYQKVTGSLFICPDRRDGVHKVRLLFNDPMFNMDGTYRQPLIVVTPAEDR